MVSNRIRVVLDIELPETQTAYLEDLGQHFELQRIVDEMHKAIVKIEHHVIVQRREMCYARAYMEVITGHDL